MNKSYSETFKVHFEKWKMKRIALYGTGIIAADILKQCKSINIVGVYDRDLKSGTICNVDILDINNVEKDKIEVIVIAAQPGNVYAVYSRIYDCVYLSGVQIYNIYGENLFQLYGKAELNFTSEDHCFEISKKELMSLIDQHDIISFDIFDTLIMRELYEPHDIFATVQKVAYARGLHIKDFYVNRIQAEINLIREIPDLAELYEETQRLAGITDDEKQQLMQIEIQLEKQVIIPRKEMVDIFKKAINLGKRVYLISDMYLPTELLESILKQNGISGYIKLYNSCDFHKPKVNGLFEIFVAQEKGNRYLHIGDHPQADGFFAQKAGINSFLIKKASEICEQSSFRNLKKKIKTWNEKLLYGLFISRLFNNPFCVDEKGRINIFSLEDLAFCSVAPTVSAFVEWIKEIQKSEGKTILFSSRDGWILKEMVEEEGNLGKGIYFYTSRLACLSCRTSSLKKENYRKYLDRLDITDSEEYFFFDLASSGTCLLELVNGFKLKLEGIFLYRYDCGNKEKQKLKIKSYLPENPDCEFWRNFKFFEFILTSFEPSLKKFDETGNPLFEREYRSNLELRYTYKLQKVIKKFYKIYDSLCDNSSVGYEFLNMTIAVLDRDKSHLKDDIAKGLSIYDSYGIGKIKIFDG